MERIAFVIACRRSVDFGVCCVDAARVTLCGVVRCRYSRIDVASSSAARSRAFVILVVGRPWISWVACVASMVDHCTAQIQGLFQGLNQPSRVESLFQPRNLFQPCFNPIESHFNGGSRELGLNLDSSMRFERNGHKYKQFNTYYKDGHARPNLAHAHTSH